MSEKTLIVVHETVWHSYAKDAGTFVMLTALIGLGVLLNSSAMQWIGAIFGFITIIARGSGLMKRSHKTVAEARAVLDEIEAAKPTTFHGLNE